MGGLSSNDFYIAVSSGATQKPFLRQKCRVLYIASLMSKYTSYAWHPQHRR